MSFSYTDDAVVSTSPTGRHLSTVIKRPCVLMSGWTEHAEAICKVLNELQPAATFGSIDIPGFLQPLDFSAVEQRCADHYTKACHYDKEATPRGFGGDLYAHLAQALKLEPHNRRSTDTCDTQASGVFVAQDGTVRAETKQRGVHWRGKIPATKTLALLSWAGKGPHTVEQVRQKCEELNTPEVLDAFWVEKGPTLRSLSYSTETGGAMLYLMNCELGQRDKQLVEANHLVAELKDALRDRDAQVTTLKACLAAPVEVSTSLARSLLNTTPGVLIHSVNNLRPAFKRVDA